MSSPEQPSFLPDAEPDQPTFPDGSAPASDSESSPLPAAPAPEPSPSETTPIELPPEAPPEPPISPPPPPPRSGCLRLIFWLLAIFGLLLPLFLIALGASGFYYLRQWAFTPHAAVAPVAVPAPGTSSEGRTFTIAPGTPTQQIGNALHAADLVDNEWFFAAWLLVSQQRGKLQAGEYSVPQPITPQGLVELLSKGTFGRKLTIPEGWTARQIAQRLTRDGWIQQPEQWLTLVAQPRTLRLPDAPSSGSQLTSQTRQLVLSRGAEGYCFPETYRFERGTSATQILDAMLAEFGRQWTAAQPTTRTQQVAALTPHEIIVLASMLEREARRPEEMPLIASVYYNRLARGMKLQCCATVYYALGEKWDRPLTLADLQIESPYNTYAHAGLPPGPIANPGRAAIDAALRPAASDFLFYVYKGDGQHIFSRTYGEHVKAIREARKRNPQASITKQSDEPTTKPAAVRKSAKAQSQKKPSR